ncbi:TerC/Alx family metal homeostasis membrane protein [Aquirufa aurantiipilula]|uniref:TerC/Alx family metal homeostasis membrane protein n=1 Tax=Aquirufa aurantiipilula TaxID=2696561 RepID=UPI001CAA4B27|nr:TerC/Alx family metal homeostasis membrane protein [Aquirufa aurantiipilula]MBZ1326131.1 TerC/Alx family metal homeostasis membrane protein [Aquirufa aurantiipilula]
MFMSETLFFILFSVGVLAVMLVDLGVFKTGPQSEVTFREAGFWSGAWVILALLFYLFLRFNGGMIHGIHDVPSLQVVQELYAKQIQLGTGSYLDQLAVFQENMSLEYITGYLVEYSLSADNVFVFILIFNSFGVQKRYYKKILVWGVLGAIVLRLIFIFLGAALLQKFDWIIYLFGAFLVYTGISIIVKKESEEEMVPGHHPVVKILSKYFNVYKRNVIGRFFVRMKTGKWYITPIFVVVVVIAFTDILFAVDSIPAIFSISKDPYIVFFSNVFAVMGLRSLFFFLSNLMGLFRFLPMGLGVLLSFVGIKMLAHHYLEQIGFGTLASLGVIIGILTVSIVLSMLFPEKK